MLEMNKIVTHSYGMCINNKLSLVGDTTSY